MKDNVPDTDDLSVHATSTHSKLPSLLLLLDTLLCSLTLAWRDGNGQLPEDARPLDKLGLVQVESVRHPPNLSSNRNQHENTVPSTQCPTVLVCVRTCVCVDMCVRMCVC